MSPGDLIVSRTDLTGLGLTRCPVVSAVSFRHSLSPLVDFTPTAAATQLRSARLALVKAWRPNGINYRKRMGTQHLSCIVFSFGPMWGPLWAWRRPREHLLLDQGSKQGGWGLLAGYSSGLWAGDEEKNTERPRAEEDQRKQPEVHCSSTSIVLKMVWSYLF